MPLTAARPDAGLLAAILDAPDDDAPRLVYADWLDEHGESERAEFIRVQCELAKPVEVTREWVKNGFCEQTNANRRRYHKLKDRERKLLARHWPRWGSSLLPEGVAGWLGADNPSVVGPTGRVSVRLARGFVAEVTLSTFAFCGGPCERCEGIGRLRDDLGVIPGQCPACACAGTGRLPGCAAALFACQPVRRVTLSDKEPADYGGAGVAWWNADDGRDYSDAIPSTFWFRLTAPKNEEREWKVYPTRAAALDALSAACVAWGREQAGLTPLKKG